MRDCICAVNHEPDMNCIWAVNNEPDTPLACVIALKLTVKLKFNNLMWRNIKND